MRKVTVSHSRKPNLPIFCFLRVCLCKISDMLLLMEVFLYISVNVLVTHEMYRLHTRILFFFC